jgi:hypothetical protein
MPILKRRLTEAKIMLAPDSGRAYQGPKPGLIGSAKNQENPYD